MTNEAAIGLLNIRQSSHVRNFVSPRTYDFVISALSWEDRCGYALVQSTGLPKKIVFFRFKSTSEKAEAAKTAIFNRLAPLFDEQVVVDLAESINVRQNYADIKKLLENEYVRMGRPLRILFDITCMPKTYMLFILGAGFCEEYFSRLDCLYAEGAYDWDAVQAGSLDGEVSRVFMSEGDWQVEPIPYLDADGIPQKPDLTIAVGGEIGQTIPVVEGYEPGRLRIVFVTPDEKKSAATQIKSEEVALASLRAYPGSEFNYFDIGDILSVALSVVAFSRASIEPLVGFAVGAKSHALAFGIACLAIDKMGVVCRVPASYRALNVPPSGKFHFYEINDRFEPSGYFDGPPKR